MTEITPNYDNRPGVCRHPASQYALTEVEVWERLKRGPVFAVGILTDPDQGYRIKGISRLVQFVALRLEELEDLPPFPEDTTLPAYVVTLCGKAEGLIPLLKVNHGLIPDRSGRWKSTFLVLPEDLPVALGESQEKGMGLLKKFIGLANHPRFRLSEFNLSDEEICRRIRD